MKSNSDVRPDAIVALGNGAYHYNFFIEEADRDHGAAADDVEAAAVEDNAASKTYNYYTVKVWNRPTFAGLVKAVIRSEIDETEEFNKVNDYNAAKEGIIDGDEAARAIQSYREFLQFVTEVKEMVKTDIAAAGY